MGEAYGRGRSWWRALQMTTGQRPWISSTSLLSYVGHHRRQWMMCQVDLLLASRKWAPSSSSHVSTQGRVAPAELCAWQEHRWCRDRDRVSFTPWNGRLADGLCPLDHSRENCGYNRSRIDTHANHGHRSSFSQFSSRSRVWWQKIRFDFLILFLIRNVSLSKNPHVPMSSHTLWDSSGWIQYKTENSIQDISNQILIGSHFGKQKILLGNSIPFSTMFRTAV